MDSIDNASSGYLEACHIRKVGDGYLTCVPNEKVEQTLSTMSSSSGYSTESFSCKSDLAGTKKRKMQNSEYADFNDIGLNMDPEEPDMTISRSRRYNHVISIISVAVLAGSGIVLCLLLVCKLPGTNCIFRPPSPTPSPSLPVQGCTVWRGTACNYQYYPNLSHVGEIRLIKEMVTGKVILFTVRDLTNDTNEGVYDSSSKMNFTVSVEDAKIKVIVHISDTQCSHQGNYNILSISDEKGFIESFWRVNVLAQCPCQMDLNITSTSTITCSFSNPENTSVIIRKVSGDNQNLLVNVSGIIRPINLQTTPGFSATWSKDGILDIKLELRYLDCSHEGSYSITVTMNGTSTVYEVYINVIDYPEKPLIAVEGNGIVETRGGNISCVAMTGCTKAQFELEMSSSGNNLWEIWSETNSVSYPLTNVGWKTWSFTFIRKDQTVNVDKRKFRCSYKAKGETFTSQALCVGMIPGSFCEGKARCNYRHPYFCNKFITCSSESYPEERPCHQPDQPEQHFDFENLDSCYGVCDLPRKANCTYKNYCD